MRISSLILLLPLAVAACHRGRPETSAGAKSTPPRLAAHDSGPGAGSPVEYRSSPAPPPTSAPNAPPPVARGPGNPSLPPGRARGSMTLRVYDTPLDYILYALTIHRDGTFRLSGQGTTYVGRISKNWQSMLGQPLAIEPSVAGMESEMDLPMIGKVKVQSGRIVLDELVDRHADRVKGRIEFSLPGPDGPSTFAGTFEVGVVTE